MKISHYLTIKIILKKLIKYDAAVFKKVLKKGFFIHQHADFTTTVLPL